MLLGVGLERGGEGLEVGEAELMDDGEELGLVALDLVEADLVDLGGGLVGGGALADEEGVVGVAVGEGPDAGVFAAGGNVGVGEEFGEALVGGQDLRRDGVKHGSGDALLVFGADGRGEFFQGLGERSVGGLLRGDGLGLGEDLFHEVLRRGAVVVDAGLHVGHGLGEVGGNFGEAGDVVVVVVGGVEGGVLDELGQVNLEAGVLVDGHLPLFELRALLVFDEGAEHEFGGELVLRC